MLIAAAAGIGLAAQVYNRLTTDQPKPEAAPQPRAQTGAQTSAQTGGKPVAAESTARLDADVRAYLLGLQDGTAATAQGTARANSRGLGAYARSASAAV